MSYKIQRRGDLVCVVDAETMRLLSGHGDRAEAMTEVSNLYEGEITKQQVDGADCNGAGIHQIVCIDPDCSRVFLGFEPMKEHAESVHTFDDIEELVRDAVREKYNRDGDRQANPPIPYVYAWCRDFATDWVVFELSTSSATKEKSTLYKASYSITDGNVTLGEPVEVVRKTVYEPVKEATS